MTRLPIRNCVSLVEGDYFFRGSMGDLPEIIQTLRLRFEIDHTASFFRPIVKELSSVIPKDGDHHVNPDGSFCVGSELDIFHAMSGISSMEEFLDHCLDPYLYKILAKIRGHTKGVYGGELAHGKAGIIESYSVYFGLETEAQIKCAARLVLLKKRIANKCICPCGCGKRLGICSFHHRINLIRNVMFGKRIKRHCLGPILAAN